MTDLHGWITQQVDRVEAVARAAADGDSGEWFVGRKWNVYRTEDQELGTGVEINRLVVYGNVQAQSEHIALNDPAAVLRRCAADRKILDDHNVFADGSTHCVGCGTDYESGPHVDNTNDCPTLLSLAEGHGLTPEILASLDRPELPPRPAFKPRGPEPDTSHVPPALRGPHWRSR
ncbi:DUF6221 family protein [Streptomyces sp. 351MFTsu5.1]|uniref:DUF6221 family protein n=1 Tax=Streptomyces sp. 351MFTsu5.1 TaxID=1172180 RepID=UPI00035D25A5|nr:DUF6221 family protein [Streptomyces sp. 351MFTsu5.1]